MFFINWCDRPILVLFGSQTGNSESIAQDLNQKLLIQNISSNCLSLNDVAKTQLKENVRAVIIGVINLSVCNVLRVLLFPHEIFGMLCVLQFVPRLEMATHLTMLISIGERLRRGQLKKILLLVYHFVYWLWAIPTMINFATWEKL